MAARLPGTIAPAALRETSVYETVLVLDSELQPDVRELRCRVEYEAGFAAYPSVGLIRRALGEFFELTLAGAQTPGRAPAVLRRGNRTPERRAGESSAGPRAHRWRCDRQKTNCHCMRKVSRSSPLTPRTLLSRRYRSWTLVLCWFQK